MKMVLENPPKTTGNDFKERWQQVDVHNHINVLQKYLITVSQ